MLPERGSDESGKSVIILPSQQFANAVLWNLSAAAQHIGEATTCTLIRSTSKSPVWYNSGMSTKTINEVEIWNGIINPDSHDMTAPEANAVLRWCFNDEARSAMEALAHRNGRGELSEAERAQLEAYVNVGQVVAILQAKARLSLKHAGHNGTE